VINYCIVFCFTLRAIADKEKIPEYKQKTSFAHWLITLSKREKKKTFVCVNFFLHKIRHTRSRISIDKAAFESRANGQKKYCSSEKNRS